MVDCSVVSSCVLSPLLCMLVADGSSYDEDVRFYSHRNRRPDHFGSEAERTYEKVHIVRMK